MPVTNCTTHYSLSLVFFFFFFFFCRYVNKNPGRQASWVHVDAKTNFEQCGQEVADDSGGEEEDEPADLLNSVGHSTKVKALEADESMFALN